jgi:hypothetical protein
MYQDPESIADSLIARTAHDQKEAVRKAEIRLKLNRRRVKALVRQAKKGEHRA